jgi:hypothetical protein
MEVGRETHQEDRKRPRLPAAIAVDSVQRRMIDESLVFFGGKAQIPESSRPTKCVKRRRRCAASQKGQTSK